MELCSGDSKFIARKLAIKRKSQLKIYDAGGGLTLFGVAGFNLLGKRVCPGYTCSVVPGWVSPSPR